MKRSMKNYWDGAKGYVRAGLIVGAISLGSILMPSGLEAKVSQQAGANSQRTVQVEKRSGSTRIAKVNLSKYINQTLPLIEKAENAKSADGLYSIWKKSNAVRQDLFELERQNMAKYRSVTNIADYVSNAEKPFERVFSRTAGNIIDNDADGFLAVAGKYAEKPDLQFFRAYDSAAGKSLGSKWNGIKQKAVNQYYQTEVQRNLDNGNLTDLSLAAYEVDNLVSKSKIPEIVKGYAKMERQAKVNALQKEVKSVREIYNSNPENRVTLYRAWMPRFEDRCAEVGINPMKEFAIYRKLKSEYKN